AAVVAGRSVPGPNGLYIVSVGYFIAGIPGACAGWLALVSPAFVIIPLLQYVGARAERPTIRSSIQALTLAAAGLIASSTIALASFLFMAFTDRDTLWIIGGSAIIGLFYGMLA